MATQTDLFKRKFKLPSSSQICHYKIASLPPLYKTRIPGFQ